jgi:hypothetical protein
MEAINARSCTPTIKNSSVERKEQARLSEHKQ